MELPNVPARYCGSQVRELARQKGIDVDGLSLDDHRRVDEGTRAFVLQNERCILEGSFLDSVLVDLEDIQFVRLVCGDAERQRRWAGRRGATASLSLRDIDDEVLRGKLYGAGRRVSVNVEVDTTSISPTDTALRIAEVIHVVWGRDA